MRVVIQRVTSAQVIVAEQIIGKIGTGLLLLVGIAISDTDAELDWMVKKVLELRLFSGETGNRFDRSIQEIQGALLVVSQFTLYGDCHKGRRPSFDRAATPDIAQQQYERFVEKLRQTGSTIGVAIETGQFGASMQVSLQNDGPVTLLLEREAD